MCCYNIYNATVVHFTGILLICCILEIESWKCLQADFSIFNNLLGKNGQAFSGQMLPGYTKAIITAHARGHHMCVWAPGPTPSAPKQQKSGVHIKSSPNLALNCHWQNPWEINMSVHWLAVPWKSAKGLQRVSVPCWIQTHVSWLTATCLNH